MLFLWPAPDPDRRYSTGNPHPLTQSATFAASPLAPSLPLAAGTHGTSRQYAASQASHAPDGDGDEDAEGEDDVGFDEGSAAGGYMDAEGEEDDEYMHSDNGSDGSDDGDDHGQEIDGETHGLVTKEGDRLLTI